MIDKLFNKFETFHRKKRAVLFEPLLKLLHKAKVTPNIITNARFVLSILFLLSFYNYKITSIVLLTVSILLDGVDGALARYAGKSSDKGKFLDVSVDLLTYSFVAITFGFFGVYPIFIIFYIILLMYAHLFAIIRKNEHKHSDWIIHPKANCAYLQFIPVFAFYLFCLFNINYLLWSLVITDALALIVFLYNYILLQIRWSK